MVLIFRVRHIIIINIMCVVQVGILQPSSAGSFNYSNSTDLHWAGWPVASEQSYSSAAAVAAAAGTAAAAADIVAAAAAAERADSRLVLHPVADKRKDSSEQPSKGSWAPSLGSCTASGRSSSPKSE